MSTLVILATLDPAAQSCEGPNVTITGNLCAAGVSGS